MNIDEINKIFDLMVDDVNDIKKATYFKCK
jgi:hypothetical protein